MAFKALANEVQMCEAVRGLVQRTCPIGVCVCAAPLFRGSQGLLNQVTRMWTSLTTVPVNLRYVTFGLDQNDAERVRRAESETIARASHDGPPAGQNRASSPAESPSWTAERKYNRGIRVVVSSDRRNPPDMCAQFLQHWRECS